MVSDILARRATTCFVMTSKEFEVLVGYFGGSSLQCGDSHPVWLIVCRFIAECDQISGDVCVFLEI